MARRKPTTYKILCSSCEELFEVVSQETGDVYCPSCGVCFDGKTVFAFIQHDKLGTFAEPLFKIVTSPTREVRPEPVYDLLNRLRKGILIVEETN